MGLSEREQQLLDELEKSLAGDRASQKLSTENISAKKVIAGVLIVLVGISVLLVGVMSQAVGVGLIGFAVMLGGVFLAVSTPKLK